MTYFNIAGLTCSVACFVLLMCDRIVEGFVLALASVTLALFVVKKKGNQQ